MTLANGVRQFRLSGSTLVIRGHLSLDDTRRFATALFSLLKTRSPVVTLDVAAAGYLNSKAIGEIARAAIDALVIGREIRVVASAGCARLLRATGVDQFCDVCVA